MIPSFPAGHFGCLTVHRWYAFPRRSATLNRHYCLYIDTKFKGSYQTDVDMDGMTSGTLFCNTLYTCRQSHKPSEVEWFALLARPRKGDVLLECRISELVIGVSVGSCRQSSVLHNLR